MTTPPLVLLHAFPLDSRLFDDFRPLVAGSVRLRTPDLAGFGHKQSPGIVAESPDLAVLADDIVAGLDGAGIEQAVIGGVSMGGYVALSVLRRHPERVSGLVLADTRCGADDSAAAERRLTAAANADRGQVVSGADAIAPMVAEGASARVRERLAAIAADVPPVTIAWAQRAMAARPDSADVLAGARIPVLVVVGERDPLTPPAVAREMVSIAADAEYVELPDVGHLPPAEDPEGFAGPLTDWLARKFGS